MVDDYPDAGLRVTAAQRDRAAAELREAAADAPTGHGIGFEWEHPWVIETRWDTVRQIGEWVLPPFMELVSGGGTIILNAIHASAFAPVTDIVLTGKGGVRIVVPEGWGVDTEGVKVDNGQTAGLNSSVRTRPERGMPRLILRGNFAGSVVVRHPRWADRRALTKWERLGRPAPALALPPGPVGSGHV